MYKNTLLTYMVLHMMDNNICFLFVCLLIWNYNYITIGLGIMHWSKIKVSNLHFDITYRLFQTYENNIRSENKNNFWIRNKSPNTSINSLANTRRLKLNTPKINKLKQILLLYFNSTEDGTAIFSLYLLSFVWIAM